MSLFHINHIVYTDIFKKKVGLFCNPLLAAEKFYPKLLEKFCVKIW